LPVGPVASSWGWWIGALRDGVSASGGSGAGGGRVVRGRPNPTHRSSGELSVVGRRGERWLQCGVQTGAVCGIGAGPDAGVGHPVSRERRWLGWCCRAAAPSSIGRLVLAGWLGRVSW